MGEEPTWNTERNEQKNAIWDKSSRAAKQRSVTRLWLRGERGKGDSVQKTHKRREQGASARRRERRSNFKMTADARSWVTPSIPRHSLYPRWAQAERPHRRSQPHDHQGPSPPSDFHRERLGTQVTYRDDHHLPSHSLVRRVSPKRSRWKSDGGDRPSWSCGWDLWWGLLSLAHLRYREWRGRPSVPPALDPPTLKFAYRSPGSGPSN